MPRLWRKWGAALDEIAAPRQGLRLVIGIVAGVAVGSLVGAILILNPLIENYPLGLSGFLAYLENIRIDNRMFAAKAALFSSFAVFLAVSFSRWSKKLADRLICKLQPALDRLLRPGRFPIKINIDRLTELAVYCFRADRELAENRRAQARWLLPGLLFSASVVTAVMIGAERLCLSLRPETAAATLPALLAGLRWLNLVVIPLPLVMWLLFPVRGLPRLVLALQFGLLPFFLLLLPQPLLIEGRLEYALPPERITVIALVLIILGAVDIIFRLRRPWGSKVFSKMALFALLMAGFLPYNNIDAVTYYHLMFELGARIPQAWMVVNGWGGLFSDFYMTYGLFDALGIILGWLAYGQTILGAEAGIHNLSLILLAAGVFAAAQRVLPLWAAWGLVYLLNSPPPLGTPHFFNVGPASVIFIYASFLLYPPLLRQPGRWLVVWGLLSAFLPFFRIPQGAAAVLATMPAAGWQAVALWRQERGQVWKIVAFFLALALVVMIWPFGRYFHGLMRMFLETGEVNNAWAATRSFTVHYLGGFLVRPWDILIVLAYALLPMLAFVMALYLRQNRDNRLAGAVGWSFFGFVGLYTLVTLSYAFACAYYWRSYQVSVSLAVVSILVVWLFCRNKPVKYATLAVFFLIMACYARIIPNLNVFNLESSPFVAASRGLAVEAPNRPFVDGADYGLPRFGRGQFFFEMPNQAEYLLMMSSAGKVLDKVLDPDETFFNLANDGSDYFLLDRKLPTEYPFPNLYPGDRAQKRAVRELERQQIKTSVWYPDFINGNKPAINPFFLRTYHLYRYAVTQGLPLMVSPSLFLIIPGDRFERLGLTPPDKAEILRRYDLMRQPGPIHLRYLPMTWGRGFESFKKELILKIQELPGGSVTDRSGVWEYSFEEPVRGLDSGLLVLDLEIDGALDLFEVSWVIEELPGEVNRMLFLAGNGLHIVPLDVSTRWLLADGIRSVKVRSAQEKSFSIKAAGLYGRRL